jgi:hypothetical protein
MINMENYLNSLIKAYDAWIATPEGKKRDAETNKRKIEILSESELKQLAPFWDLNEGGVENGYVLYWCNSPNLTVKIELEIDKPIQFGGKQSYKVTVIEEPDDDEEEEEIESVIGEFDAEKDWKAAAKQAKDVALDYMKRIVRFI